ncbi:MAG: VIT1/CCC1 transporter family protein, partial [Sinobacteraceae bacterium]|nr:VIT1/CCC1 transporter family protein [Nevskiaceae bacterium]
GANDGTISVSSLIVGVATSGASTHLLLLTGVAGLVAGVASMAAGEYVSVQSQADAEAADLSRERRELREEPERELAELTSIYVHRGLDRPLAQQVARKLMSFDALGAHARDELGITETLRARPLQAAIASGVSFLAGGVIPILATALAPAAAVAETVSAVSIVALASAGGLAAYVGKARILRSALRVAFWGALAMGLTAVVGRVFGTTAG